MSSPEATADIPPSPWTGRDDGPGAEHLRWHHAVQPAAPGTTPAAGITPDAALVGFRSDEGVRRNKGRPGAADGPRALREALSSMALPAPLHVMDAGDVEVGDGDLASGQQRLGAMVSSLLGHRAPVMVLGGGHEVAYGTYQGLLGSGLLESGHRLGVLNLDAHFDLREDRQPSSGTPFLQMARSEEEHGRRLDYRVLGVSQPSNTQQLFRTADRIGARHLPDTESGLLDQRQVDTFVDAFLADCDLVHLSIDLDVLPAAVAPGVSAPAAYGVPMQVVERICVRIARSGKLTACDIAELNPQLDIDNRTARAGARLIHRMVTG